MRISELEYDKLTEDDMYNLIMSGVVDFGEQKATDDTKVDSIVVLGCSARPLKGRIKKMMQLQRNGYSNNIVFSGGRGWQKLVKQNPEKKPVLVQAIKDAIKEDLLGDNPSTKQLEVYKKFNEEMKKMIGEKHQDKSYQEASDDKKMEMTEEQFMRLILITNGGLEGAKIYHDPFSTNTKENALYIGKVFETIKKEQDLDVEKIMMVTSSFHCTRSKLNFMKLFPGLKVRACPSTEDMKELGVPLSREMMKNKQYHDYVVGEAKKIIDYSRKGDIADVELTELVSPEIAKEIEARQRQEVRE
jgi:uncharacterized SAM-binding protein YcdF (DUF218 family)